MSIIDPDLIQRYYSQLSNQELIALAKNEGNKLTDEAIDFLYDEFVNRGLDTGLIQQLAEKKKQIKEAAKMDTYNWNYALKARQSGKTDTEILQELTTKQISETEAALIIKRLPSFNYKNEQFEKMISSKSSGNAMGAVFGVLFLFGIGAYFLYLGLTSEFFLSIIIGTGAVIAGIYFLRKNDKEFKSGDYWVEQIKMHPEKFVWIKPIVTKHTVGFILTWWNEQQFQLWTTNEEQLLMTIDTEEERNIFFEGVRNLLPHAHIGFTYEIDALYSSNPGNFIATLQERQLYTPIDTFTLPEPSTNIFVYNDPS